MLPPGGFVYPVLYYIKASLWSKLAVDPSLPCPMGMKKVHTLEILEGRRCLHRLVNQPICPDSITCFGLALLGFLVWVLSISFSGMCLLFCMWVFCFAMSVEPVYLLSVQLLLSLISNASLRPFPFRAHEKMALFNTVFPFDSLFEAVACWLCFALGFVNQPMAMAILMPDLWN